MSGGSGSPTAISRRPCSGLPPNTKPDAFSSRTPGTGTSLVQELRRGKVSGIVAVKARSDKVSRMAVVSAKFESGQVFLPQRAPWLADFERELFAFPGGKHDDQCDSVSQALSEQRFPMIISDAASPPRRGRTVVPKSRKVMVIREDARKIGPAGTGSTRPFPNTCRPGHRRYAGWTIERPRRFASKSWKAGTPRAGLPRARLRADERRGARLMENLEAAGGKPRSPRRGRSGRGQNNRGRRCRRDSRRRPGARATRCIRKARWAAP